MSDTGPVPPRRSSLIRNPQDVLGGLAMLAFAAFALWASRDLPGQQGFAFGPGTAPRLFGLLLVGMGIAIVASGLATTGPVIERFALRGPLFITAGVLVFAASIQTLGLLLAVFLLVVVSSAASPEVRWLETVIWGALLAAFSGVLFPFVLNLPLALLPRF